MEYTYKMQTNKFKTHIYDNNIAMQKIIFYSKYTIICFLKSKKILYLAP